MPRATLKKQGRTRPTRRSPMRRAPNPGTAVGTYVGDAWSLAKRTAVGLNEIRKLINVEHKYNDRQNSLTCTQAGNVQLLTNIGQGDDINQRDGDSIKLQSIKIRGYIRLDAAATLSSAVRVLLVRDLQNPGATITGADLIQQASSVYAPVSHYNFINGVNLQNRFTVIYDEVQTVDPSNPLVVFDYESKHDCHVFFRGTGTAFTDCAAGAVFLVVFSDATVNLPIATFTTRVLFTDN